PALETRPRDRRCVAERCAPRAHRNAAHQPTARSLPIVAAGRASDGEELSLIRETVLRRGAQWVWLGGGRREQSRRASRAAPWRDAAADEGRSPRPSAETTHVGADHRSRKNRTKRDAESSPATHRRRPRTQESGVESGKESDRHARRGGA